MKVTVLIAVHDGMPWIAGAVDSVLAQTHDDFELLIVDDASKDGTAEALAAHDDPRIRILRNERNLGQVPSLNRGLREAQGEYVARLDADDRCLPTRLERQVAVLDALPRVGLVGAWIDVVGESGRRLGAQRGRIDDLVSYVYATLVMRVYVAHPAAMFRRQPVLMLGGYDESLAPSEDHDLWRRLLLDGWDARIVPETLVEYRVHDAQLSRTRAELQVANDRASQERFLAALAPGIATRPVMLLLAGAPELWREDILSAIAGLDAVIAGAAARFGVDAAELEALVDRRVAEVAARRPWNAGARALLAGDRRAAARALAVQPLREVLRVTGRALPFKAYASRSWFLRRLFGKLAGTN